MKFNQSSYFPLKMISKNAPEGLLFGPTTKKKERDCIYPEDIIPLNATIIWNPEMHKSVSLESYLKAQNTNDVVALAKIQEIGIPLGLKFEGVN